MQHGMIWAETGMMQAKTKASQRNDVNYVGGFFGALSTSPDEMLPGDLETARLFGRRVAEVAKQFTAGARA